MPTFEIQTPRGRYEVNAPDEQQALQAIEGELKAMDWADRKEAFQGKGGAGELFGNSFVFGLQDKVSGLAGGLHGLISGEGFSEGYNTAQRGQQIYEDRAREKAGGAGTIAEVAGSILGPGSTLRAAQAPTALGRVAQTAKESGKLGLIQGVGDTEQTDLPGVATDVALSGATGFGLGAGLGGAIELGRGLYRGGKAIVRGLSSSLDDEAGRAGRKVAKALADDGISPQQAASRMATRNTALINTGDENLLGLGRAAASKPGEGRKILTKALDAQQKGSQDRVLTAVNQSLGQGSPMSFNMRVAKMVEDRATKAQQMYEPAFAKNFANGHSMKFDSIAKRIPGEAVRNAQKIALAEGRPFGEQLVASIADDGLVTFKRAPSLREWHYIQRGLRSATDSAYKSGVGEVGTAYKGLHKELLAAMDEASPMYRAARKSYASQTDLLDALNRGREILNPATTRNVDSLADEIAGMSASEREMLQIGLARQMQDMLQATPDAAGDMVKKVFGNQAKRNAIRAAFGNDTKFRAFEAEMARIAKEAKAFQYVRTGSRTSIVDAEKAAGGAASEVAGAIADVASGSGVNLTLRATAKMLKDMGGMDEGVAREVAKILVERDPNLVMKALSPSVNRAVKQQARAAIGQKVNAIVRGMAAGAATGGSYLVTGG